ncbi:MAG: SPOR domain-containing protein [Saprospiraceae bacterium]
MKRLIICCIAILAFGFGPTLQAQNYLRKANKQFELGDFAESIPGLERYVRKNSKATKEMANLAHALRMTNQLEAAAAQYQVLATAEPNNPDYAYLSALSLMEAGQYGPAVEKLAEAALLGHPQVETLADRLTYAQAHENEPSAWRISNEFVNTAGDEFGAQPFKDFTVFASEREGSPAKLFLSSRDDNNFLRVPRPVHKVLTNQDHDAPVAYSPSGELVAFTRNNFQQGERFLPDAGWELSLLLGIANEEGDFQAGKPFVHNGPGFNTGFPAFSPNGESLYFASDRPGGQGGYDLYVSKRTASGWGTPVNLGESVNTPGNEISPFAVGNSIYFSSDNLPGFGGMDIYRADLMGATISTVVNMGVGVNSPADDAGFSMSEDGQWAYFHSNRTGGKGNLDLYRGMRNGKAVTLAVVDGKTGAPIPNAVLDFSSCGQGNFLTGLDGEYTFRAVSTLDCRPTVQKSGYNAKEFSIRAVNLSDNQRVEIKLNPEDKISIYEGKVLNARTGDVISDVKVLAEQIEGPFKSQATSDASGRYELKLERESEYVISYTKAGMADINREVTSYDSDGGGILSSFAMFPDQSMAAEGGREMTPFKGFDTSPSEYVPTSTPSRSNTGATPTSTSTSEYRTIKGSVLTGFAVQVAALSQSVTDITEYQKKLGDLGQVYGKRENGVLRIRIGPFESRGEASKVLPRAQKLGYSDAYIAKEEGGLVVGMDKVERVSTPAPKPEMVKPIIAPTPVPVNVETKVAPIPEPSAPTAGAYLIRLATYGNFSNFEAAKVSNLGTLTTRKRGEYTVVLIQGFGSADAAKAKINEAQAAGFKDAHVVLEEGDGTLKKVR